MARGHRSLSGATLNRSLPRLLTLLLACAHIGTAGAAPPVWRDGDLVFQQSQSTQSLAIQRATGSRYSHMGMVMLRDGQPYVLEASATVRYTPLAQWIGQGHDGHYVAKRLRMPLDAAQTRHLRREAERLLGRPYDTTFEWSDRRIYCSELVWKAYQRGTGLRIGQLQELRDFRLDDPAVRAKLRERYGKTPPHAETVISPKAMFDSSLLVTVGGG